MYENIENSSVLLSQAQRKTDKDTLLMKVTKLEQKSDKTFENLSSLVGQAISFIEQTEIEIQREGQVSEQILINLHNKMAEVKPLSNMRNQFKQLYRKVSGFSKNLEQLQPPLQPEHLKIQPIFNEQEFQIIQEYLADHYIRQKDYQKAQIFMSSDNLKKNLYEECHRLKECVLNSDFDPPIEWADKIKLLDPERNLGFELKKLKIIALTKGNKGEEAIQYIKKQMSVYADIQAEQISLLMGYVLAMTKNFWAQESQLSNMLSMRYRIFENFNLDHIADYFVQIFYKRHNLSIQNTLIKCYNVGQKYSRNIIEQMNKLPQTNQIPKLLPITLQIQQEDKYHSQFLCPINKQVYGSEQKCVVLKCGHMISQNALGKIIQNRNSRRKLKCPICQKQHQSDQYNTVQF